jgi:WD40 repeat protein
MIHHDLRSAFNSPSPSNFNNSSRYFYTRRIESAPGFDIGTPYNCHVSASCRILKAIKATSTSVLSPVNESTDESIFSINDLRSGSSLERILDAPEVEDDYYLNLMDLSNDDILAVALKSRLYTLDIITNHAQIIADFGDCIISSVSWMKGGSCLAIGDSTNNIRIFDMNRLIQIRNISVHKDRVSSLSWKNCVLTSGSRDKSIVSHDVRAKDYFFKHTFHKDEVCGLKWNQNLNLLASGSNDNSICIWDQSMPSPIIHFSQHSSAVKALAWCPWKHNVLASGGGKLDRCIKIWDCSSASCMFSKDTGSQVSAIEWNSLSNELISGHGFSKFQVSFWKGSELVPAGELFGHCDRILGIALSNDQETLTTISADETLRFWRLFTKSFFSRQGNGLGFQSEWR